MSHPLEDTSSKQNGTHFVTANFYNDDTYGDESEPLARPAQASSGAAPSFVGRLANYLPMGPPTMTMQGRRVEHAESDEGDMEDIRDEEGAAYHAHGEEFSSNHMDESLAPPSPSHSVFAGANGVSRAPPGIIENQPYWLVERDLDAFYNRLYDYYRAGGLGSLIATRVTELLTSGFTVVVCVVFVGLFDWTSLTSCQMPTTCSENFSDYIFPFTVALSKSWTRAVTILFGCLCLVLWCARLLSLGPVLFQGVQTRAFYRVHLGLTTRELQTVPWSTVVSRLVRLQSRGHRLQINNAPLTALTIALRIMRKDNFMIALINRGLLPLGSPDYRTTLGVMRRGASRGHIGPTNAWWMGNFTEMSLRFALFDRIIDSRSFTMNPRAVHPANIRSRLKFAGGLSLVFMPIILLATLAYAFLRYAEELHSKRNYLGPRWYSPHALWTMRELNELPHLFERRIHASLRPADRYLKLFPQPVPTILARGVAFVSGGVVAIFLVLALVDDAILLHLKGWDNRLLVWYAAVASSVLAVARGFVPAPEDEAALSQSPNLQMRRVARYTHLLPDSWRRRAHTFDVHDAFSAIFTYRIALLLREMLSVLSAPYVLGVVLAEESEAISKFFTTFSTQVDGVGTVCVYSLMRLKAEGDVAWREPSIALSASRMLRPPAMNLLASDSSALLGGKLEKAWLAFRSHYPIADAGARDDIGESWIRRVLDFRAKGSPAAPEAGGAANELQVRHERAVVEWESAAGPGDADMEDSINVSAGQPPLTRLWGDGRFPRDASISGGDDRETDETLFWWVEEWRDAETDKFADVGAGNGV